jgi:hypothetical protein
LGAAALVREKSARREGKRPVETKNTKNRLWLEMKKCRGENAKYGGRDTNGIRLSE